VHRCLILFVGILIGQWLAFGATESPADVYRLGRQAWARSDWNESVRQWSRAVSMQPDNAYFNYMRAASLARLGHRHAAADGFQVALLMQPEEPLAGRIRADLASLSAVPTAPSAPAESVIRLEHGRGVWIAPVVVNGQRGRFLLDSGSSVIVVSPSFAARTGVRPRRDSLELETLGGRTRAPWVTFGSLRVGDAEVRNVDAVVHPPTGDLDGILGNSFLSHWDFSLDPDRRVLRLRSLDATVGLASPK
jgi:clan AA aspartic protease (TIGR02281 family)